MEDPQRDIRQVIHLLCQTPPSVQRDTIERFFTPDATFTHPFCRTGKLPHSRLLIRAVYRWYKIMSPRIDMRINSVAYDPTTLLLYVHISQVFRIWAIPFYAAPVSLVTVLHLAYSAPDSHSSAVAAAEGAALAAREPGGRYYIAAQNDLYQVSEFVRFVWPGGFLVVWLWQLVATFFCVLGALLLWPVTLVEEFVGVWGGRRGGDVPESGAGKVERKYL
ncbi:uncharacterized protein K452DRAFT_261770 [Aplosporella prunicola CBS 121167]|uniref:SigF-like NTF2-like domain-containing protein n=1 Tax=Aplosporella prunicola CBS 121167 TaxID=1176127 RepID=A0A6A6BTC4_9PEZI|nr:uncharacterized protein K452DRAFT_261770 [Aplosporella prunicola CBS 121167]KAF2147336.1 hypothetical protein K452DRAFT_261770 [Aplosporella prunicola CBS 121167]